MRAEDADLLLEETFLERWGDEKVTRRVFVAGEDHSHELEQVLASIDRLRKESDAGLIASEDDEVLVVLASGKVVRSAVAEVPAKGRDTMGVVFARAGDDDRIIAIARNSERNLTENGEAPEADSSLAADPDLPAGAVPQEADAPDTPETPEGSTDA